MLLNDTEQKFFALLRLSLSYDKGVDEGTKRILNDIRPTDWAALYEMSEKQALLAVVFSGVCKLPQNLQPPRPTVFRWIAVCEQIKRQNVRADEAAVKAIERLRKAGFGCCLLKGQGNALMYPNPRLRISGDVDVWTDGDDLRALRFAASVDANVEFYYHHAELPTVGGLPVEMHYRPAFLQNFRHNKRLQEYFKRHSAEQFANFVELPDGAGRVAIPTPSFNRIFQLCHIVNHFGHEGIGLRQIVDYYYVLRQGFTDEEKEADVHTLKSTGMYCFACGLMYILHEHLGLESRYLLVEPNQRMGEVILHETLCGGNFGQHDARIYAATSSNKLVKNIVRLLRDVRLCRYYPSELLSEPFFRLWHYAWRRRMSHRLRR